MKYSNQQIVQYKNEVKDIVTNNKSYGMIFKKKQYLHDFIEDITSEHLSNPFYTFRTKLYWVVNDLNEFPRCKHCNKEMEFKNIDSLNRGYCQYCSNSCGQKERTNGISNIRKSIDVHLNSIEDIKQIHPSNRGLEKFISRNNPTLHMNILKETSFLKDDAPIASRLYCIEHNIKENPICHNPNCNNAVEWYNGSFRRWCSSRCRQLDPEFKNHIEEVNLIRFGAKHHNQSQAFKSRYSKFKSDDYPNMTFDSSWEYKVYDHCIRNGISVEYQPNIMFQYECNGIQHTYHPDFLINGEPYEVKGEQFFNQDGQMINPYDNSRNDISKAKHQCMVDNGVIILRKKEIKNLNEVL